MGFEEFTITQKAPVRSAVSYITKGGIAIESGLYHDGLFQMLDVDMTVKICHSWEWRFQKLCLPIAATAFGDLFLYGVQNKWVYFYQPQYDTLDMITKSIEELLNSALVHPSIRKGVLQEEKLQKVKLLLTDLKYGETYILKLWEMLGGTDQPENYVKGELWPYLDLVSQTLRRQP